MVNAKNTIGSGPVDDFMAEYDRKHREALAQHPAEPSLFINRLVREHQRGREGHIGLAPVSVAQMQLATPGGCWQTALATLRKNYDEETTAEAWWWLMADPKNGWATWNESIQLWTPYCVPGYSPLCGDSISGDCKAAHLSLPRKGTGQCPWGRSGKVELRGLEPNDFAGGDMDRAKWITTGLIDKDDPDQVYHLQDLGSGSCGAKKGTSIRTSIVPPGRYYLGVDAFQGASHPRGAQQALMGMFDFEVRPGETVVIEPDPSTGRLALVRKNPIQRAAGGLADVAKRNWRLGAVGGAAAGVIAALLIWRRHG